MPVMPPKDKITAPLIDRSLILSILQAQHLAAVAGGIDNADFQRGHALALWGVAESIGKGQDFLTYARALGDGQDPYTYPIGIEANEK